MAEAFDHRRNVSRNVTRVKLVDDVALVVLVASLFSRLRGSGLMGLILPTI